MKQFIFILVFILVFFSLKGQTDNKKSLKRTVKEEAEMTYLEIQKFNCSGGCFEDVAFMTSQLQPSIRTISLRKLPDVVAFEVKKLKNGEFTKPVYVKESCYIVKRIKKNIFRYKLNIIYYEKSRKPIRDLPKN